MSSKKTIKSLYLICNYKFYCDLLFAIDIYKKNKWLEFKINKLFNLTTI